MSTPAFPAAFTISDITPDGPTAFSFFILIFDSQSMPLPIKQGMLLAVSV